MHQKILNLFRARTLLGFFTGLLILNSSTVFAEKNSYLNNFNFDSHVLTEGRAESHPRKLSGAPIQEPHTFLADMATKASNVVASALNMIGVRYRWGATPRIRDWIAAVLFVMCIKNTLGFTLPRRAVDMSRVGEKIIKVTDLKPGDLVFFNTMRRTFSHVGIYIGDNKFVHSPSTGNNIRVDALNNRYWEKRYTGARRIEALLAG